MKTLTPTGTKNRSGQLRVPRRSEETGLYEVPKWQELVDDPRKAGVLDARTARIVAAKTLGLFAATVCRLLDEPERADGTGKPDLDDIVPIEEIARIFGKERSAIIRMARDLPFVYRVSRKNYLCSKNAFAKWLASRSRTRKMP